MTELKTDYPDGAGFWPAFAREADLITDAASTASYDWAQRKIDAMIINHASRSWDHNALFEDKPPA